MIDVRSRRDLLISQYRESPRLLALLDGLLATVQTELIEPLAILDRAMSPEIAEGALLDWLGQRLGFPRPQVIVGPRFGFDGAGETFDHAPFATDRRDLQEIGGIGDDYYQRLLAARALYLRSHATAEDIEAILGEVFGVVAGPRFGFDGVGATFDQAPFSARSRLIQGHLAVVIRVADDGSRPGLFELLESNAEALIPRCGGVHHTLQRELV